MNSVLDPQIGQILGTIISFVIFGIIVFETTKNKENKIKNGNLDNAVEKVQNFFNEQWHIKQNLNFAMQEGL